MRHSLLYITLIRMCFLLVAAGALTACDEVQETNVEDLIERATDHRDKGKLRASVIDLKSILRKDPKHTEARLMLGQIYLDIHDADSAEKELDAAIKLGGPEKTIQYLRGKSLLLRGNFEEILEQFQIEQSESAEIQSKFELLRGRSYFGLLRHEEAKTAYHRSMKAYRKDINEERPHLKITEPPEFIDAMVGLANIAISREQWDEAKKLLNRASLLVDNNAFVLASKGELTFRQGELSDSESAFKAAFAKRPFDPKLQIGIARAQILLEKYEEAITNLDAIRSIFPKHLITNYFRSLVALQTADYNLAKTMSESILADRPNFLQVYRIAGAANYSLGNYEQAQLYLNRFSIAFPTDKSVRHLLGLTLMRLNRHDDAVDTLQPLSEEQPDNVKILKLIATAAAESGNLALAGNYFEKALKVEPDIPTTHLQLAAIKHATGRAAESIEEIERALQKSPKFLRGRYALLSLYLRNNEFEKALDVAGKLREQDNESPMPFIGEGAAYIGLKNFDKALAAFNQGRAIDPYHVGAAFGAADIHLDREEFDESEAIYKDLLAKKPGHLPTLMRLIGIEFYSGKVEQAKSSIALAMKEHPKAIGPRLLAAQVELDQDRPDKAMNVLQDVIKENPDQPDLLNAMGRAQIAARKGGEAARTLERLVRGQPNSSGAHYLLSQAYALLGNRTKMHAELDLALSLDPKNIRAGIARVRGLVTDNKVPDAKRQFASLKKEWPDRRGIKMLDAWLAMRDDRAADAAAILKEVHKESDTEKVTIDFAAALWESGKSEAAVNVIETWLKKHPDRINAQFELANYYLLQNRSEDAKPLLVLLAKRQPNNWIVLNNLADALKHEDRIEALRLTTCLIARLAKPRARAASADVGACTAVTAASFSIPKTTNNASRTATESGRNTNNSQPSARIRFAPTKHVKWTPRNGSTDCIRDPPFDERLPIDR